VSVLVVAEHVRGRVRDVTYELITAAQSLGGPVAVAAIAPDPAGLSLDRDGVDEIIHVRLPSAEFENDVYQAALAAVIAERTPDIILLGHTVNSIDYAPALAAKLDLGFASDVIAVRFEGDDGALTATRA